ncbi:Protein TRANSPARENT TESTA 12 [Carex littledalei]|uniref:Protein TRANSPARENT TESTA 12 n=1 Tax=Carex littledalei TaxID=544730 RepID=A0A833R3I6_9POAL|nr:Protein TRANSPARENT TESTA 12 [Carex littledalei]
MAQRLFRADPSLCVLEMWGEMLSGVGLQTTILICITLRTNWKLEDNVTSNRNNVA